MSALFGELKDLLVEQLALFRKMSSLQIKILSEMEGPKDFSIIMKSLQEKETIAEQVSLNLEQSRPQIAMWLQDKDNLVQDEAYEGIELLLSQIEGVAEGLKEQDEKLISLMNPPSDDDPLNRIHAYRALK